MKYSFKIKDKKKHIIFENNEFPLLNQFLQIEGVSFDDIIEEHLLEYKKTKKKQYFSGNIFSMEITGEWVILRDKLADTENIIPNKLFIKIFFEWLTK